MASASLLFLLLLMSSSLPESTGKIITSSDPEKDDSPGKFHKIKQGAKEVGEVICPVVDTMNTLLTPFLGVIDPSGALISASVNFVLKGLILIKNSIEVQDKLDTLKNEFDKLIYKLDKYHMEQKWNTWASGNYYKIERDINLGWREYEILLEILDEGENDKENDKEKKNYINHFLSTYSQYEPAIKKLYELLRANGAQDFGKLMAEHMNCHENEMEEHIHFIFDLLIKGLVINQVYYKLKHINSEVMVDEAATIAFKLYPILLQIYKNCVSNSMKYVENDVLELIDNSKNRQQLAKEIRTFLEKEYDRYDWMVVVYVTKNSKYEVLKILNKHKILIGFTKVEGDKLTVAVARQVKGKHTLSGKVKEAMDVCFGEEVKCQDVEKVLTACKQTVESISLSKSYTALHSFKGRADDSFYAKDEPNDVCKEAGDAVHIPYIYRRKCKGTLPMTFGRFVILVKSDEELMDKQPCSEMDCGDSSRAKCVPIIDNVAICECKDGYFGEKCEMNLKDFKDHLKKYANEAMNNEFLKDFMKQA